MAKYSVPVVYEVSGSIEVEADSPEAAIEAAREKWWEVGRDTILLPTSTVDFAHGDDPDEVTVEDDVP